MYAKFFRVAALLLFGVFVVCRMFITNGLISDIILTAVIVLFLLLAAGGLLFDATAEQADRRGYRNFSLGFAVVLAVWVAMLLVRYVFTG